MSGWNLQGMPVSSNRLNMLAVDFSGMKDLEERMNTVLQRLVARAQGQANLVKAGQMSLGDFDGAFAELIRVEMGKQLAIIRNKAVENARKAGAGSAATAVSRRMYKDRLAGNVNILPSRKRKSSRKRVYNEGKQRTVSNRTRQLNEYYGPDRDFILRFLDSGTDARTVDKPGVIGRGSKASWGRRGSIASRNFFSSMGTDMEQAAQELGTTLVNRVTEWLEKEFE